MKFVFFTIFFNVPLGTFLWTCPSTFLCMLAYYLCSFRKILTKNTWVGSALFKGKVISYEPTCSHKQCDRIGAITTVPTLYIPLYKGLYTLRVNLLTKIFSLSNEIPIGNKMYPYASNQIPNEIYVIIYLQ